MVKSQFDIQKLDHLNTLIHLSSFHVRYPAKGKRHKKAHHYQSLLSFYQIPSLREPLRAVCVCVHTHCAHTTLTKHGGKRYIFCINYIQKCKSFPHADYNWQKIWLHFSLMTLSFWDSDRGNFFVSSLEVPLSCAFPPSAHLSVKSRDLQVTHSLHIFPMVIKHPALLRTI